MGGSRPCRHHDRRGRDQQSGHAFPTQSPEREQHKQDWHRDQRRATDRSIENVYKKEHRQRDEEPCQMLPCLTPCLNCGFGKAEGAQREHRGLRIGILDRNADHHLASLDSLASSPGKISEQDLPQDTSSRMVQDTRKPMSTQTPRSESRNWIARNGIAHSLSKECKPSIRSPQDASAQTMPTTASAQSAMGRPPASVNGSSSRSARFHDPNSASNHIAMNTPVKVVDQGSAAAAATASQSAHSPRVRRVDCMVITISRPRRAVGEP